MSVLSSSFFLEAALASWSQNVAMTPPRLGDRTAARGVATGRRGLWAAQPCFHHSPGLCWDVSGSLGDAGVASWPSGAGSSAEAEP